MNHIYLTANNIYVSVLCLPAVDCKNYLLFPELYGLFFLLHDMAFYLLATSFKSAVINLYQPYKIVSVRFLRGIGIGTQSR